jgi:hypothetical protein
MIEKRIEEKMKTKKDRTYSFNHFKERLKERYGLDINEKEYNILCLVNTLDIPISTEHQKNDTQKVYDVIFKEKIIRVVYSEAKQIVTTVLPIRQHHIWCNFPHTNPDTCKMCERFYRDYPMDDLTPDELLKKHFPNAIKKG